MDDGEEKKDPIKSTPNKEGGGSASAAGSGPAASGLDKPPEFANPLYCTSVDGKYVYKDPATQNEFVWDEAVKQWKPKGVAGGSAVEFDGSSYTYTDASDGTKYEWDAEKSAWFPKVDDEFLARYQLSYGFNTESESTAASSSDPTTKEKPLTSTLPAQESSGGVKRKLPPAPPTWFELDDSQNTKVYVSNLPLDITEPEFVELMQKCGLVQKDPQTQQMKIKLYQDEYGNMKGDGLCTYFKIESVQLALQIIDGSELRGKIVHVERAKFQLKGAYDPSKKPKQKKRKEKEKLKKMEEQLFAWRPEKLRGERPKHERVVVVQNGFSSSDFDTDASLILEYQEDFREEASKCGTCKKVVIFDRHPEGVLQIFMSSPEEADAVVNLFNGRFFGGKQITAFLWDGQTKYKIAETDAEREERLQNWEKFIAEGGSGEVPEEEKVTPPRRGELDDDELEDDD